MLTFDPAAKTCLCPSDGSNSKTFMLFDQREEARERDFLKQSVSGDRSNFKTEKIRLASP